MVKRKAKRRRTKTFSILNGLEALAYGQILSVGITGGGIWDFVTGSTNLGMTSVTDVGLGISTMELTGQGQISLGDFMSEPTLAIDVPRWKAPFKKTIGHDYTRPRKTCAWFRGENVKWLMLMPLDSSS